MSTLSNEARNKLLQIEREKEELFSQAAGVTMELFNSDQTKFDQEDIAFCLALTRRDRGRFSMIDGEHKTIIESLKIPVLDKGNEIFCCGFRSPELTRRPQWAILFESQGLPHLEMIKGDISLVFPECDYKVYFPTSDLGDFHTVHGNPRIELHLESNFADFPFNYRKVSSPEGPFPCPTLLKEMLTANPFKYGSIICNRPEYSHHFIAAKKVWPNEGCLIVYRLHEVLDTVAVV